MNNFSDKRASVVNCCGPRVTIIASIFNAATDVVKTSLSIRSQSYRSFKWIIVDGGSDDGTLDIIRENADLVDV